MRMKTIWNKLIYDFYKYKFSNHFAYNIYLNKNIKYKHCYLYNWSNHCYKNIISLPNNHKNIYKLFYSTINLIKELKLLQAVRFKPTKLKIKSSFYYYLLQHINTFNKKSLKQFKLFSNKNLLRIPLKFSINKYLFSTYKFKYKIRYPLDVYIPQIIFYKYSYKIQLLIHNSYQFNLYKLGFKQNILLKRGLLQKLIKYINKKIKKIIIYDYNLRANPLRRRNRDLNTYNLRSKRWVIKSFKKSWQAKYLKKFVNTYPSKTLSSFFKKLIYNYMCKNIAYNRTISPCRQDPIYNLTNLSNTPSILEKTTIWPIRVYDNTNFSPTTNNIPHNIKNSILFFKKKQIISVIKFYNKYKLNRSVTFKINLNVYKKKYNKIIIIKNNNITHLSKFNFIKFIFQKKLFNFHKIFKYSNKYYFYLNIILSNFFFKYKKSIFFLDENLSQKYKKKKYNIQYFAYKIKLKPGFVTLWRLIREQFKSIYKVNFKFQHMLTKYINLISSLQVYYKLLYWYNNIHYLFKKSFWQYNNYLWVYTNGNLKAYYFSSAIKSKKNIKNYIYTGDIIQLPINYRLMILYKSSFIFKNLLYINYDISTFSAVYLYYNNLLANWGLNKKYYNTLFSLKIYNWKYLT